jgi:hypothetical protein
MTRFSEYTTALLAGLSTDAVIALVELECAYRGVSVPGPMPVLAERHCPAEDAQGWAVGDILFVNKGDAQVVCDLINRKPCLVRTYKYLEGNNYKYSAYALEPTVDPIAVGRVVAYSPEFMAKHKAEILQARVARADFTDDKAAYDARCKEYDVVSNEVWSAYNTAQAEGIERARLLTRFTRYLELAEGNFQTAWIFLSEAEDLTQQGTAFLEECEAIELSR